ncbi:MAG: hypothetical protein Mars2KO_27350 [Maribacter sp.]
MKTPMLIILSFLLVTAILAPTVLILVENGENTSVAIDFNEEEKKEEKKEVGENDFFLGSNTNAPIVVHVEIASMANFYLESDYSTALAIFLPPPKQLA